MLQSKKLEGYVEEIKRMVDRSTMDKESKQAVCKAAIKALAKDHENRTRARKITW